MSGREWLAPWLILAAMFVYGVAHSLLASHAVKRQVQAWLGGWAVRSYRLVYNILAFVALLPVLALAAWLPDDTLYVVPFPWAAALLALQMLALLALALGVLQTGAWSFLGLAQFFNPQTQAADRLVTHGLYRWVRHPLYSAGLLFIWCSPVMTRNTLTLYLGVTIYLVIGAWFEEKKLLADFGEAYALYRARTPMLIPGLNRRSWRKG
jgi:protein-S-isoprenylcysteine O-methyltransferase Ste14